MSDCCDPSDTFWEDQLAAAKALAAAIQTALIALTIGGVKSYQLDTGQTRQLVTKESVGDLREALSSTLNLVATLEIRLGCGGSTHVKPGF